MFSPRSLALVMSASLMTGCAVGPDYHRPDAPLSAGYVAQPAVERRAAATPADLAVWWESFGDPMLSHFVARALAQNLDLAQASARVSQARAGLGAATAALLPSASINGQAGRAYQSIETPLGQVLNTTPDFDRYGNSYEANLGASWELDIFGGLRRGRQAALAEYQASEAGAAATRLAVAAQTADIYVTIRGLQTRLDIANRQVKTQQDLLEKVQLLHSKGLAAEYQVRQTDGSLAQVQATIPVLQTGLDAAMNALDVMLGTPPGTHRTELAAIGEIPRAPQISSAGTPADLLRRRPDLIVAERRLAASNARIGVAIPSITQSSPSTPCWVVQHLFLAATCSPMAPASRQPCWACAGGSLTSVVLTHRLIKPKARKLKPWRLTANQYYVRPKMLRMHSRPSSTEKFRRPHLLAAKLL